MSFCSQYTGEHTREEVAAARGEARDAIDQKARGQTHDRRATQSRRRAPSASDASRRSDNSAAADKLERKRREAEARMRTQPHPVASAVPSESNAEANRAAAADVLKFAVADKIKAKMAANAPKKTDDE
jgi:hypothetical protein